MLAVFKALFVRAKCSQLPVFGIKAADAHTIFADLVLTLDVLELAEYANRDDDVDDARHRVLNERADDADRSVEGARLDLKADGDRRLATWPPAHVHVGRVVGRFFAFAIENPMRANENAERRGADEYRDSNLQAGSVSEEIRLLASRPTLRLENVSR